MQSEISQRKEDKYCMISLTGGVLLKIETKQKRTHRNEEQTDDCQEGEKGEGDDSP